MWYVPLFKFIILFLAFAFFRAVKPVVKLVRNDTRENVCIGTIVNLTCKASANPLVDTYTLYKNNDVVVQRREIMEIETLDLPGQYIYRCEASNTVGTGRSSDTILTVGGKYEDILFSRNKQGKTKSGKMHTHTHVEICLCPFCHRRSRICDF